MIESVNLLALLAATLANMGLGFLWYSPVMFAKPWMKLKPSKTRSWLKSWRCRR